MTLLIVVFLAWIINAWVLLQKCNDACDRLSVAHDKWYLTNRQSVTIIFDYYTPWYPSTWFGIKPWINGDFKSPTEK